MRLTLILLVCFTVLFFSCERYIEETDVGPLKTNSQFQEVINPTFQNYAIKSILADNLSFKWIGTNSGLFVYDNEKWYRYLKSNGLSINSINSHDNEILIATSNGAFIITATIDKIILTESINKDIIGGTSNIMYAFGYDIFGKKWIGSVDGLAFFDGFHWLRNEKIRNNLGGISDISSMAFGYNNCFFGTFGKYLYHISYNSTPTVDGITGASQMLGGAIDPETNFNGELTSDSVYCVSFSSDSSIWFGSSRGLTRNNGNTNSYSGLFEYFLRAEHVHCVIETSDKKIWAGTENGLYIRTSSVWKKYNTSDGLSGNIILSISEDEDASIWIGTNKGVSHFKNGVFTNY